MAKAKWIGSLFVLCAAFSTAAEAKLYKWVDSQGETHYGEVIPPEYAGQSKVQIDKGREVKEKEGQSGEQGKLTPEQQAAIEQQRRDKALVNTYSNEKEIDLARDRNLQQVNAMIDSIHMLQQSTQESLNDFNKEAAGIRKAGKPIPPSLQADIANAQEKIEKLKHDLTAAEEKAASVKASFEADKARYRELTGESKK